jgi:hypothetical protein
MLEPRHRIRRFHRQARPLPARAAEDLRYIRQTMERSAAFTAVSGGGQILLGLTALVASWIAAHQTSAFTWLRVWLAEAIVAMAIAMFSMHWKANRSGLPLFSGPGRKVALGVFPPLAAGAVLTFLLFRAGITPALPATWLLLYGAGIATGGMFSVAIVPVMGLSFMIVGTLAALGPVAWGNWFLAAGFGGLHILFGSLILWRHGG